jgi:hypothetical protein
MQATMDSPPFQLWFDNHYSDVPAQQSEWVKAMLWQALAERETETDDNFDALLGDYLG